jgi:hypothetical protein
MNNFPNKDAQFKKGESGNPNGRPKGSLNIKTLIQRVWDEVITDSEGNKVIEGLLVVRAMMEKAKKGDVSAFKALSERMDGMPKQELDLHSNIVHMPMIKKNGKDLVFDIGGSVERI